VPGEVRCRGHLYERVLQVQEGVKTEKEVMDEEKKERDTAEMESEA